MKIPANVIRIATKAAMTIKKYSPQIMMAVGTVTSVAAVVEAVKQTPKAIDILEEHKDQVEKFKEALSFEDPEYGEEDYKNDLAALYIRTGTKLGKTYLMPILMEATSLLCFFNAHRIMCVRNKALTSALAASVDAYNNYRNKVVNAIGEEAEEKIRLGVTDATEVKEITDENGKKKKIKEKLNVVDPKTFNSAYDILWEDLDPGFDQSMELNMLRIGAFEGELNKRLFGDENGRTPGKKGIVNMISLNDIRKFFKKSSEAYTQLGQIAGYDESMDDDRIILRAKEVSIPDPENPRCYRDAIVISPNISGSIVKEFIV